MANPFLREQETVSQNPFLRPAEEPAAEVDRLEYLKNSALLGLSDTLVLGESFLDTFVIDPLWALGTGNVSLGAESTLPSFGENVSRLSESAASITGANPYMTAPDLMTKIVGGGVRMATDPFGYVGKPAMATKEAITQGYRNLETLLKPATEIGSRTALLGTAGVSAEIGGEVGAQFEEGLTGEDTGVGRLVGSVTGAVSSTPSASIFRFTVSNVKDKGKDAIKAVSDKYKNVKGDKSEINIELSSGAAKQLLKDIAEGTSEQNIENIVQNFNRLAPKIGVENVPIFVALSDNPAVKSEYNRLIRKDPAFRKLVDNEAKIIAAAIDKNASKIFGTRYADVGVPGDINNQIGAKLAGLRKQREDIDERIFKLSEGLEPAVTKEQLGVKIENLVKAREAIARSETKPLYKAVIDQAEAAGATMSPEAVNSIYQFAKQNRLEDLFGKGTAIDREVLSKLKPRKVEVEPKAPAGGVYGFAGVPSGPTTVMQSPELTFRQVDSMKRAINAEKNKRLSADTYRRLTELESVFDNARATIPGDYNQRLAAVDKLYYEKVGVPFNKQGIQEIGSKGYAEQVAPVITKNKEAFDSFINVTGDQGYEIAKNAMYAELYENYAKKTSTLSPSDLKKFMFKKREVIDAIPGFRDELKQLEADVGQLFLKKDTLDVALKEEQTRVAQHFLNTSNLKNKYASTAGGVNFTALVNDMMSNRSTLTKIYKDLESVSPTVRKSVESSLRAELFNIASKNPEGAFAYLTDKKNAASVDRIMGKGYSEAAKDLSLLADAVNRADTSHLAYVNAQKDYESIGGIKYSYLASQLRDRIASVQQKAIRIFSKAVDVNRGGSSDEALKKLMLDNQGLKKLQSISKEVQRNKTKEITVDQFNRAKNVLGEVIPVYIYSGIKIGTLPQTQETTFEQQPKVLY